MRINIIDEICDYIRYLNTTYNIEITIHPLDEDDYLLHTRIIECNSHNNLFCHQVKIVGDETRSLCLQEQYNCFQQCSANEAFYYTCFAGVTQLIFPIYNGKSKVGYVAVGNFYTDKNEALHLLNSHCKKYNVGFHNMKVFFDSCITEMTYSKSLISTIVSPILSMIEIAYLQGKDVPIYDDNDSFYLRLLSYIKKNYTSNITIKELAKRQNCSVSYISHFFKKQCGMSLPEYINFLRINDAKAYFEMTNMTIQEVSNVCGYSSANYFSTAFKKIVGISPKKYKEQLNAEKNGN